MHIVVNFTTSLYNYSHDQWHIIAVNNCVLQTLLSGWKMFSDVVMIVTMVSTSFKMMCLLKEAGMAQW